MYTLANEDCIALDKPLRVCERQSMSISNGPRRVEESVSTTTLEFVFSVTCYLELPNVTFY